jgi:hypothetical protein
MGYRPILVSKLTINLKLGPKKLNGCHNETKNGPIQWNFARPYIIVKLVILGALLTRIPLTPMKTAIAASPPQRLLEGL